MRFHGVIGYWNGDKETSPGIWESEIVEKSYTGDVLENIRRFRASSEKQNNDLELDNQLSIISDLYLRENWNSIRYVIWNGVKWTVSSVRLTSYPRVILQLGGVYNGKDNIGTS